ERGRAAGRVEDLTLGEVMSRLAPSLHAQANQAGMELVIEGVDPAIRLRTDASVVGQILANLVDNAGKYADSSEDRRIHIVSSVEDAHLVLTVSDHGPGLSRRAARRPFRPFSKSAHDAAQTAPGVGLGLALSRRLARALGGDLRHVQGPT